MTKVLIIDSEGNRKEVEFKPSKKCLEELEEIRKKVLLPICRRCPFYKECYDKEERTKSKCKIRL